MYNSWQLLCNKQMLSRGFICADGILFGIGSDEWGVHLSLGGDEWGFI